MIEELDLGLTFDMLYIQIRDMPWSYYTNSLFQSIRYNLYVTIKNAVEVLLWYEIKTSVVNSIKKEA